MKVKPVYFLTFVIDFLILIVSGNFYYNFGYVVFPVIFCLLGVVVTFVFLRYFNEFEI